MKNSGRSQVFFRLDKSMNEFKCCCTDQISVTRSNVLETFDELRKNCDVLQMLVPDDIYPNWRKTEKCLIDHPQAESHRSRLTFSFEDGSLGKITTPVHRYLSRLNRHYKKDLQEKWLFKSSPVERHLKFRSYMGKMVELIVAEHLSLL